ncbi:MAG TPA: hypothetical protein VE933_00695, partial [Chitinophagaceae bacterium]|nr:hypothetical protein [Chitinophagaceae bacterium]
QVDSKRFFQKIRYFDKNHSYNYAEIAVKGDVIFRSMTPQFGIGITLKALKTGFINKSYHV